MQPCLARDGETLPDAATAAGAGAANPREAARVSAGAACDGIAEEPARHSHRLRAAQLGRPGAYTEDGRLKMDNNGAEQALRPIVLGRKNYLFAGSEAGRTGPPSSVHSCRPASTCKSIRSCTCAMSSIVCPRIRSGWSWSLRHASGSASARILWHKPRPERLSFRAKALWCTGFRGHPIVVGVLWDLLRDLVVT